MKINWIRLMKIKWLFITLIFIAALPTAVFSRQSIDEGPEGTDPEPECDYTTIPDFI
jgi:hypothetical protein